MPVIDVLIPAFNCAATVESAIASIQKQTIRDIRLIIVDDGSTDETPEILRGMAAADDRLLVLRKSNGGIVDALNFGLRHCTAEYIARHDADDLAYPERFEIQLRYLQANPDCAAVGSYARHIDEHGRLLGSIAEHGSPDVADPTSIPAHEPYLMHPFLMVRTEAIVAAGGYRHVYLAEDADLYWRLQEKARLHNIAELLGEYRMHGQSLTGRSVHHGRLMALFSQLAAVSAVRRRAGREDLTFTPELVQRCRECEGAAAMFAVAGAPLTAPEKQWLKRAVAMRMVQLTFFRPFTLDAADCQFIGEAFRSGVKDLPAIRISELRDFGLALIRVGRMRDAFTALPRELHLGTIGRAALRQLLPGRARHFIQRMLGREVRTVQRYA